jgi:hypothetical protein
MQQVHVESVRDLGRRVAAWWSDGGDRCWRGGFGEVGWEPLFTQLFKALRRSEEIEESVRHFFNECKKRDTDLAAQGCAMVRSAEMQDASPLRLSSLLCGAFVDRTAPMRKIEAAAKAT